MPSKYSRKRKHDLDEDTTENKDGSKQRDGPSPAKKSGHKSDKKKDEAESMSIEETNKLRAELGLAPLEVEEEPSENVGEREDGGVAFKEDGVEIVHKAAKNLAEDKESMKLREKLELQKEKHRLYGKVLKTQKGLGESDSEDEGGVDNFLEKMRAQAEKKALAFDSLDQEAEQDAAQLAAKKEAAKKAQQQRRRKAREDALTANLLVGHSKDDFTDGTETILVLQDKGVLDDDTEELLINPNLIDNERHKRNVEKRKQKSDYSAYDEDVTDELGVTKKKAILDKYDDLDGDSQRETFRLDASGGFELDREEQELETKRRLMMANKKFESLEAPKYIQAREFYTEEEMLTFRKPKKKKDKLRKTRTLKAADLENVQEESSTEKLEKAKRLAARRRDRGEPMEVDEETPKNGSSTDVKPKKSATDKDTEEGEVVETEQVSDVGAPLVSKWKQGTGASVDLSRIRSFAAKVDKNDDEEEESEEDEELVQGVDLAGVIIDDEAEDELYGALAQSRKLKQIKEENESTEDNRAKYVRKMLSSHGVIKEEPTHSDGEEKEFVPVAFEDGIIIDATSEQYKMIGEIPTFGLAGNRNDDIDYSELVAEHKRIAEQQLREQEAKEKRVYSDDDEDLSDIETEIKTEKLKRRRGNDSDIEMNSDDDGEEKPMWKAIGDDEPTSSKHASDSRSTRSYRKSSRSVKQEEDEEVYGDDYKNVLGEERDVTKGVGAMLRLAAEKGYLENNNRGGSGGALRHLESKRFSRVDQGKMDIEDKYIRKLERMGTTGSGPIRAFAEKSDYKPGVEITYTDNKGRLIEGKEAFRELSHKFHGKGSGKKKIEKRDAKLKKQDRMKQMNSSDTPLGTLQKQLKKQEQLQSPFIILSGSNRSDLGSQLQKD